MGGIYWLASYPKSGNTWFRAFLHNLREDADKPARINELTTGLIASARPWLDEVLGFDTAELTPKEVERLRPDVYRWSLKYQEIEYHKIHDAYTFTDRNEPLVSSEASLGGLYIIRNPLDIVPSAANHWNLSIDEAIDKLARRGKTDNNTRQPSGLSVQVGQKLLTWSEHVLSWADVAHMPIETIRYEDMQHNSLATFSRAAKFLQLPDDPERIAKAIRFSNFELLAAQEGEAGFRERPQNVARFFRKGKSGGWRQELTATQVKKVIADHRQVMQRFGYVDANGTPIDEDKQA